MCAAVDFMDLRHENPASWLRGAAGGVLSMAIPPPRRGYRYLPEGETVGQETPTSDA